MVRHPGPLPRRSGRLPWQQEGLPRCVLGPSARAPPPRSPSPPRGAGSSPSRRRGGGRGSDVHPCVLQRPAARDRLGERGGPRLDRRVRHGLPRRRAPLRLQPVDDLEPRDLRPRRLRRGDPPLVPERGGVVGDLLDPALPARARAAPARRARQATGQGALGTAVRRMRGSIRELRHFKDAGLLLLAFLIYNDAINTIIRMATTYGTRSAARRRR